MDKAGNGGEIAFLSPIASKLKYRPKTKLQNQS